MVDGDGRYSVRRPLIDNFDVAELAPCTPPCLVWRPSGSCLNTTLSRMKNFATQTQPKAKRGGPRNSDSLLRWDPDQGEGVWNATEATELSC